MPLHDPEMYGIRACPTGWSVEITRRGTVYQRYFAAGPTGDRAAALARAQAWRDELVRKLPAQTKAEASQRMRRNNTTGCPGVYRMEQKRKRVEGVQTYVFWSARSPEGIQPPKTKSFSVQTYGEQGAYERAVEAREAFVRELQGYHLPTVPRALHPDGPAAQAAFTPELTAK
ncbi:hypothetical protein [Ideonella oryzae]|uniref:AP2 domain-containing protein n=1 Tax=Ideonella oryzae TaxID=2937441 RepID=A0ABT1BTS2_9BURK|nr:hypothetical protein [Ideonella oryzae]MCO5978807.1 hypothetical protein [Ideonella oryzae]